MDYFEILFNNKMNQDDLNIIEHLEKHGIITSETLQHIKDNQQIIIPKKPGFITKVFNYVGLYKASSKCFFLSTTLLILSGLMLVIGSYLVEGLFRSLNAYFSLVFLLIGIGTIFVGVGKSDNESK